MNSGRSNEKVTSFHFVEPKWFTSFIIFDPETTMNRRNGDRANENCTDKQEIFIGCLGNELSLNPYTTTVNAVKDMGLV